MPDTRADPHTADYTRTLPEPAVLRATFAGFPSGVAGIAAMVDGADHVIVASSFTVGVSLDPPLVMFAVQNGSRTWPQLRAAGVVLGVSIFGADQDRECRQLAGGPASERFAGINTHRASSGALFVRHAPVWLECKVWSEVPAGDHTVVILQILALFRDETVEPLVFHGSTFRRLERFDSAAEMPGSTGPNE